MLYFYRNRHRFSDWQAVVIYPSRNIEQSDTHPYRVLLNSDQMHRIYLNELGEFQQLPLGVASMVLTTLDESQAPEAARNLLERSRRADLAVETSRAIIDMVTTIMVYKFTNLSRQEIEAMLDLRLEEARAFQEIKEEGREEGRQQEAARFVVRLLTCRFNQTLSEAWQQRISALSIEQLERLGEALLDFSVIDDLEVWLRTNLQ